MKQLTPDFAFVHLRDYLVNLLKNHKDAKQKKQSSFERELED
ncbi:hypothetical protein EV06_1543 [Prochlorococcus sp. MIT 0602]|nr:hypothetical protein EV06_1543 [Prochlorococcus sp. MIT 0602]